MIRRLQAKSVHDTVSTNSFCYFFIRIVVVVVVVVGLVIAAVVVIQIMVVQILQK